MILDRKRWLKSYASIEVIEIRSPDDVGYRETMENTRPPPKLPEE
jgi:hypothetical protein